MEESIPDYYNMVKCPETKAKKTCHRNKTNSRRASKQKGNISNKNVAGIAILLLSAAINLSSAFSFPTSTNTLSLRNLNNQMLPPSSTSYSQQNINHSSLSTQKQTKQKCSKTKTSISATSAATAASTLIQSFTKSSSALPSTIADIAVQTPPVAYFLALLSAGFGVPVSEDALCIFSGAVVLPCLSFDKNLQIRLLVALYAGVVISDMVTFLIGRSLRLGVMNPIRKYLNIGGSKTVKVESCEVDYETGKEVCKTVTQDVLDEEEKEADEAIVGSTGIDGLTDYENDELRTKIRRRDRIKSKIQEAGDYIGFVTRMSVGVRGPIMLLSGFSGSVSFWKFVLGSAVGACVSLPAQLFLGYFMKDNPGAIVKAIAGISTLAIGVPTVIAVGSWINMLVNRVKKENESDVV